MAPTRVVIGLPRSDVDEVLRVVGSLQLTANHKVSTPIDWKQGENVIIAASVSE